jgi:hypothetical protein
MISDIQRLVNGYLTWLNESISLRQIDEWVEITTPFLDRHNDYLQIYVRKDNGGYVLTDDGYILEDLKMSGCKIDTEKRQTLLLTTLKGFGVQNDRGVLTIKTTEKSFPQKKHNILQAMLAVNDLFYLSEPIVASLFYEDVVAWLDEIEIRYSPKVKFTGKSGYDHLFDFVIPKSRQEPERILQTINNPNRAQAEMLSFSWIDTKDVRAPDSKAYAILNDKERRIPEEVPTALENYGVLPLKWSKREQYIPELIA